MWSSLTCCEWDLYADLPHLPLHFDRLGDRNFSNKRSSRFYIATYGKYKWPINNFKLTNRNLCACHLKTSGVQNVFHPANPNVHKRIMLTGVFIACDRSPNTNIEPSINHVLWRDWWKLRDVPGVPRITGS